VVRVQTAVPAASPAVVQVKAAGGLPVTPAPAEIGRVRPATHRAVIGETRLESDF